MAFVLKVCSLTTTFLEKHSSSRSSLLLRIMVCMITDEVMYH